MKIGGIQKSSTIDFPGHLSCVLFTVGCNLDCFYCHNRALLSSGASLLNADEVDTFLKKRIGLLSGVVISGGEPTLQEDLYDFVRHIRSYGYAIKLDTNGQLFTPVKRLLDDNLIDYLAVDLKALPQDYPLICGHEGYEAALCVLQAAMQKGITCEARTTVYPSCQKQTLLTMAQTFPPLPLWRLNVYHMPAQYKDEDKLRLRLRAMSESELTRLLPELQAYQPHVFL